MPVAVQPANRGYTPSSRVVAVRQVCVRATDDPRQERRCKLQCFVVLLQQTMEWRVHHDYSSKGF